MEQVKGISGSQGATPARGACGSLDCRFPGVRSIIHPDTNPLFVTSRVQFLRSHSIKNELALPAHFLWSRCPNRYFCIPVFSIDSALNYAIPPKIGFSSSNNDIVQNPL
jgi:hypothetical protein